MKNREIWVYDIETLKNCFTYTALNIDTQDIVSYVIHNTRNDIKALITHLNTVNGHIGYNNLSFDGQIIQWIIEKYEKLLKLDSGDTISNEIYNYAQITIEKSNKSEWGDYPEWKLKIPQLDLFKVWHFNNKNKMTSLKWVEYSMDLPNIEEMPISHDSIIEEDKIQSILDYNLNDVIATYKFYKITIGETEHSLYKGVDKIQLRRDIKREFGIKCTNFNDVKIGDEINKLSYLNLLKIEKKNIPKPIKDNKVYKFKDCFPEYIKFKTTEFNNFVNGLANIEIKAQKKDKKSNKKEQEFEFTFNSTTYCIAKGGIHSKDKPRIIKPSNAEVLRDADIGSQYPWSLIKRKLYPRHLNDTWLVGYTQTFENRIKAKKEGKKSINEAFKLSLNGGGYGKLGEEYNWQFDPFIMNCVTIGNQMEILMLIEKLELNNIHVVSANTDGIVCLFNKSLDDLYYKLCKEWEIEVGNNIYGQLEYTDYKLLVQTNVNDYITIKTDNKIKTKGDFTSEFEIHRNKSKRIVPIALQNYFVNNIPIKETILNHKNIYDFCLGAKSIGSNRLIHLEPIKGNEIILQKINRYYISNNGWHLIKRLKPLANKKFSKQLDMFGNVNDGSREQEVEAGWLSIIFNKYIKKNIEEYDINYNFYIENCNKIINLIENK